MPRKIPHIPRILIRSDIGYSDWSWYCQWIRSATRVDELGFAVYRPRPDSFYTKDPPDVARQRANQWNIANAGRPLEVLQMGRMQVVQIESMFTYWHSVRNALGILDRKSDMNIGLPSPDDMSDAEIVDVWGIDYALDLWRQRKAKQDREDAAFERAVEQYEKKIGRLLTATERDVAKTAR